MVGCYCGTAAMHADSSEIGQHPVLRKGSKFCKSVSLSDKEDQKELIAHKIQTWKRDNN